MCKICRWALDVVEMLLVLLLMIVVLPLVIIDDIVLLIRHKDPKKMTEDERSRYGGYGKGW